MQRLRRACGPFFVLAGLNHFAMPKVYASIVPDYLPAADFLVFASGVAEAGGGLGLMSARTRRHGGILLLLTLAAVFPANVEMARHPERFPQIPGGALSLKARLPFQAAFAAWVLSAMKEN